MSIVERMARAICEQSCEPYPSNAPDHEREYFYASMTDGFTKHARAALRAIKPEDVSDGMADIFEERFLNHINMNAPNSRDDLRRAIAAMLNAAGAEQ